jgi:hypothetical protein
VEEYVRCALGQRVFLQAGPRWALLLVSSTTIAAPALGSASLAALSVLLFANRGDQPQARNTATIALWSGYIVVMSLIGSAAVLIGAATVNIFGSLVIVLVPVFLLSVINPLDGTLLARLVTFYQKAYRYSCRCNCYRSGSSVPRYHRDLLILAAAYILAAAIVIHVIEMTLFDG